MSKEQDERQHPRTPLEVTVDWHLLGTEDVMWSATDDVGPGGLRIRTLTPPEEGSQVRVVLGTPEHTETPLRVPGRVAWTRMDDDFCGMGVAFEPEGDDQRDGLVRLFEQVREKTNE